MQKIVALNMRKICFSNFLSNALLLFMLSTLQFSFCSKVTLLCIEEERDALIKFKQNFSDSSIVFSSWTGSNCCEWKGVTCNRVNSHVVKLAINPMMQAVGLQALELSPSLLKLRHLSHLDLSGVHLQNGTITKFIGEMKQLKHLVFPCGNSDCDLRHLGNLTNLEVLDLRFSFCALMDLEWISHLQAIKHLDLSGMNLNKAHGLMKTLSMLPSLSFLGLSSCELNISHLYSYPSFNSTYFLPKLQFLDLSHNSLKGPIPPIFQNMTSLKVLDLSYSSFNGLVPRWFGKFRDLFHLNLDENDFKGIEGGIFLLLRNLSKLKLLILSNNQLLRDHMFSNDGESPLNECNLEVLALSGNNLTGSIPMTFGLLTNLSTLDLSHNKFNGSIPDSLGKLSALTELYLYDNILSGITPESLGNLSALKKLDLHNNALNGIVPSTFGQLYNLIWLDLSNNNLEGIISEIHFLNQSCLRYLNISNNHLTLKVDHQWIPPFQLHYIGLGSCIIGTKGFPQWIQTQKEIVELVLSNTHISGTIPIWLSYTNVSRLDLSHNQLTRFVHKFFLNLSSLDLSNNSISGPLHEDIGNMLPLLENLLLNDNYINGTIPSSLCDMEYLVELDLGRNKLSGSIPNCWGPVSLALINLSHNNLSGALPSSIGSLSYLGSLHLNDNGLHGEIPESLAKCQALVILDLGGNNFTGSIPPWIGKQLFQIQILRLRQNNFNGTIPQEICDLFDLQILDLAANNLQGIVPRCLGFMPRMTKTPSSPDSVLVPYNYSDGSPSPMGVTTSPSPAEAIPIGEADWHKENVAEVLKGMEIEYTKTLELVINLDLSSNYLAGSIPEELTLLSRLLGLNLSYNHFSGNIPEKLGNMMSLESLDLSNNNISGKIPESIATLSFLSRLNLSNNNLSGKIPVGNQLQTISYPSVYDGNPLLCGYPLPKQCPTTIWEETPVADGNNGNDVLEELLFWIVVMLGYAIGFWGVIGVLVFKKSWRLRYFKYADEVKEKVYVFIALKVIQLDRRLRRCI